MMRWRKGRADLQLFLPVAQFIASELHKVHLSCREADRLPLRFCSSIETPCSDQKPLDAQSKTIRRHFEQHTRLELLGRQAKVRAASRSRVKYASGTSKCHVGYRKEDKMIIESIKLWRIRCFGFIGLRSPSPTTNFTVPGSKSSRARERRKQPSACPPSSEACSPDTPRGRWWTTSTTSPPSWETLARNPSSNGNEKKPKRRRPERRQRPQRCLRTS